MSAPCRGHGGGGGEKLGTGATNVVYNFSVLFLSLSTAVFDYASRNADLALFATNELDYTLYHGDIVINGIWYLKLTNLTA
jgi:hypothetical protein